MPAQGAGGRAVIRQQAAAKAVPSRPTPEVGAEQRYSQRNKAFGPKPKSEAPEDEHNRAKLSKARQPLYRGGWGSKSLPNANGPHGWIGTDDGRRHRGGETRA